MLRHARVGAGQRLEAHFPVAQIGSDVRQHEAHLDRPTRARG